MKKSTNIHWHSPSVTRELHEKQNRHQSALLWFTGLSGAGKSTLAHVVEKKLYDLGCHTAMLDGDNIRHGLSSDLGFNEIDRNENTRRIAEVSKLFVDTGLITLAAFVSPFRKERERIRQVVGKQDFIEIYVKCPMEVCEQRDVKKLYQQARVGKIRNFTGVDSPYEPPLNPELIIDSSIQTLEESTNQVLKVLNQRLNGVDTTEFPSVDL